MAQVSGRWSSPGSAGGVALRSRSPDPKSRSQPQKIFPSQPLDRRSRPQIWQPSALTHVASPHTCTLIARLPEKGQLADRVDTPCRSRTRRVKHVQKKPWITVRTWPSTDQRILTMTVGPKPHLLFTSATILSGGCTGAASTLRSTASGTLANFLQAKPMPSRASLKRRCNKERAACRAAGSPVENQVSVVEALLAATIPRETLR
ncbi:hypothetical protein HDK90DRAFT_354220 [Phyllosticta capitalensis]|uniref:Uncharacterized protein n=1 Tax=Phyllosticta capitalensis TaxID=121624 RepID=A0ABR1YIW5_9PEZI